MFGSWWMSVCVCVWNQWYYSNHQSISETGRVLQVITDHFETAIYVFSLSLSPTLSLSISIYLSIYLSISFSVFLPIYPSPSMYLSTFLHSYPSHHLCLSLPDGCLRVSGKQCGNCLMTVITQFVSTALNKSLDLRLQCVYVCVCVCVYECVCL